MLPATNSRPGTHHRKKGVILSIAFRKTPKSKEKKEEGRGSVAATTYGMPAGGHL